MSSFIWQAAMYQVYLNQNCCKIIKIGAATTILLFITEIGWLPKVGLAVDAQSNPLEMTTPDPLLPQPSVPRPLSPLEISQLKNDLDQLNQQASAQLQAGKLPAAFEIWHRELRLRRVLGLMEEIPALGRVGGIAWKENQKTQLQLILGRLQTIQNQALGKTDKKSGDSAQSSEKPVNLEVLKALGDAYQQMRSQLSAVEVYQQLLAAARQRQDQVTEQATLKTIAQTYLNWFDYPKAAAAYEELLTLAQAQGDNFNQLAYVQQLAYIYDQAKQPENSIKAKQKVAATYLEQNDLQKIPALKIAIAADYLAINQPEDASKNYQEAYSLAITLEQFDYASQALQKLGDLYKSYDQLDYALQVYQIRVQINQQSSNFYDLMNSYDQIGQIYVKQKNYTQALNAFKEGLEIAKSLNYQESYFATQIEQVGKVQ